MANPFDPFDIMKQLALAAVAKKLKEQPQADPKAFSQEQFAPEALKKLFPGGLPMIDPSGGGMAVMAGLTKELPTAILEHELPTALTKQITPPSSALGKEMKLKALQDTLERFKDPETWKSLDDVQLRKAANEQLAKDFPEEAVKFQSKPLEMPAQSLEDVKESGKPYEFVDKEGVKDVKLPEKLDMSPEARAARAKQMGFDPSATWYHGTTGDIQEFDPKSLGVNTAANSAKKGFFFSSNPETANSYALGGGDRVSLESQRIYNELVPKEQELEAQLKDLKNQGLTDNQYRAKWSEIRQKVTALRQEATDRIAALKQHYGVDQMEQELAQLNKKHEDAVYDASIDPALNRDRDAYNQKMGDLHVQRLNDLMAHSDKWRDMNDLGSNVIPANLKMQNPMIRDYNGGTYRDEPYSKVIQEAIDKGHDGVILKNTRDSMNGNDDPTDLAVVFQPTQVRSKFAAFDPDKASNGNLSAGVAGAAALPALKSLMTSDEGEDESKPNL